MACSGAHVLEQVLIVLGDCPRRALISFVQLLLGLKELIPGPNELRLFTKALLFAGYL